MAKRIFLFIAMLIPVFSVSAAEVYTTEGGEISYILFVSSDDLDPPSNRAGTAIVSFNEALVWRYIATGEVNTNCSNTNVAIRAGDSHLISAALAARASQAPVRLYANINFILDGNICFLKTLQY